jgi:hypothetical protein
MSSTKENIKIGDYIWIYTSIDKINKWEPIKIVSKVDPGKWKAINLYNARKEFEFNENCIHIASTSLTFEAKTLIQSFVSNENTEFQEIFKELENIKDSIIFDFVKLCKPKIN